MLRTVILDIMFGVAMTSHSVVMAGGDAAGKPLHNGPNDSLNLAYHPAATRLDNACVSVQHENPDRHGDVYVEITNNCGEVVNITTCIARNGQCMAARGSLNGVQPGASNRFSYRPTSYGTGSIELMITGVTAVGRDSG